MTRKSSDAAFPPLDPSAPGSLVDQLAERLRAAIRSRQLRPGDRLPSFPALAEMAGTSPRIPREAIALLVGEGFVAARRGAGTVVLDRKSRSERNKRILLIHPNEHGAYYLGILMEEIDRLITDAGYNVSRIAMRKDAKGDYDFSVLERQLRIGNFAAALAFAYDDKTIRPLTTSSVPFVTCTFYPFKFPNAKGRIDYSHRSALPAFIRHCRQRKISRVLQIATIPWLLDATDDLRSAGFEVENITLPYPKSNIGKQEQVERDTFTALDRWLCAHPLPDLILFTDDFASRGGILALTRQGIRFPQDVKVVAWSNAHFGPVAPVTLTRMVMDPFAHAKLAANAFLAFLRTGKFTKRICLGPRYSKGESFA